MELIKTPLKDCYVLKSTLFGDDRGFFLEAFHQMKLKEVGIDFEVKQINFAQSSKSVLRGLHFQVAPFAQNKLVGVVQGAVLDVVVDLRKDSPSYLQHFKLKIDQPDTLLLVPKGFAHGYHTLSDQTLFYYAVDVFYSPEHERGLLYNDKALGIDWELDEPPLVSPKDRQQLDLKRFIAENQ